MNGGNIKAFLHVILVLLAPLPAEAHQDMLAEVIREIRGGVVGVGTLQLTRRPPALLTGTGFVVGDGQHIITNAHVVVRPLDIEHNEKRVIFVGRGTNPEVREITQVALDTRHDIALYKFSGSPLTSLTLAGDGFLAEGESIAFTGFPIGALLGLFQVTHRGMISAITPIAIPQIGASTLDGAQINALRSPYDIYQLDATAYPGNSGSPLYEPQTGRVVGVLNMVFIKDRKENVLEKPSGISYAIPVKHIRALLNKAGLD